MTTLASTLGGELDIGWFDGVPEDAYWNHGDAVDDIRRFVERSDSG